MREDAQRNIECAGIVGLKLALVNCACWRWKKIQNAFSKLRDKLETELMKLEEAYVNGSREHWLPHVSNISFKYVEGEGTDDGL